MEEKKNQFQPLGICRRLFNVLVNDVIARGMKRVSLGSSFSKSNREEMEPLQARGRSRYGPSSGSEAIEIHFKDTEGQEDLENWSHIDHINVGPLVDRGNGKAINSVDGMDHFQIIKANEVPDKSPFNDEKARKTDQTKTRSKDPQGVEPNLSQARGPERGVVLTDKGKNVATEQAMEQPTRDPINVLAQNINERSESFINSRKEAMRRHLSMELKER